MSKLPFVRLLIPFVLGISTAILIAPFFNVFANTILCVSILCSLFFVMRPMPYRFRAFVGIPLSIALFFLGERLVFWQNEQNTPYYIASQNIEDTNTYIGQVTEATQHDENARLTLKLHYLKTATEALKPISGNLLLRFKTQNTAPQAGDILVFDAKINVIESPKNPESTDFRWYWHIQNIHYQAFIQENDFKILQNELPFFQKTLANTRRYFLETLQKYLPTEREYAVAAALLIGYRDALSDDTKEAYIATGAMHILAISGMHFLLIFNGLKRFFDLRKTGSRRWRIVKNIVPLLIIWFYVGITGGSASIVRAAVMSTFSGIGGATNRQASPFNHLAASAFLLLAWQPLWLFDVGFQLSFGAVLGIFCFEQYFSKIFIFNNLYIQNIWKNIATGFAAQLGVLPISLYYFHSFPTYFWLTGLLVVAISDFALIVGIVLFLLSWIDYLNLLLGKILFGIVWIMNEIISYIQKLPFALVTQFWLEKWEVVALICAIFGIAIGLKTRRLRHFLPPLSMLSFLSLFWLVAAFRRAEQKEIVVYHFYKKSLVEFVAGEKTWIFFEKNTEKNLENSKLHFAVNNYHNKLKIKTIDTLDFDNIVKNNCLYYHKKVSQFGNVRLLILDKLPHSVVSLSIDYVLVQQNAPISMSDLSQKVGFKKVIFDGSNARWRVERWKAECQHLGIPFHDTFAEGAWVLRL